MKQFFLYACTILMLGSAAAFDLNNAAPGIQFPVPQADDNRQQLFTDAKPVKSLFTLGQRDVVTKTSVTITPAHELVIKPENGSNESVYSFMLKLPAMKKFRMSFSIKCDDFFARNKADRSKYNRMIIRMGGVYLFLRGDNNDMRYFDKAAKKYVRGIVMKNGEWSDIVIDVNCGTEPTFTFNGKTFSQRSKCESVDYINFSGAFTLAKPDSTITIKNMKVTPLQ